MQHSVAGYQAYQKNKYETASPHKLILMLYDGAIRYTQKAIEAIEAKNILQSHQCIVKSQDIMYELVSCLDEQKGGEMAKNLKNLYLYVIDLMVQSNLKKDSAPLKETLNILQEIRSAWDEIGKDVSVGRAFD